MFIFNTCDGISRAGVDKFYKKRKIMNDYEVFIKLFIKKVKLIDRFFFFIQIIFFLFRLRFFSPAKNFFLLHLSEERFKSSECTYLYIDKSNVNIDC